MAYIRVEHIEDSGFAVAAGDIAVAPGVAPGDREDVGN
jgi:hypothetical protein